MQSYNELLTGLEQADDLAEYSRLIETFIRDTATANDQPQSVIGPLTVLQIQKSNPSVKVLNALDIWLNSIADEVAPEPVKITRIR